MATRKHEDSGEERDLRAEAVGGGDVPEGQTLPSTDTQRDEDTVLQTTQTDRVVDEPTSSPSADRPTLNSPGEEGDITQETPPPPDGETKGVTVTLPQGTKVTTYPEVADSLRALGAK
jgi:hypothetical protein